MKRCSTSPIIREMQIKTIIQWSITPHQFRMAIIKKFTNNKCWRGYREKGTFLHYWWECKLVQPLWRTVWRFLKKTGKRTAISWVQFSSVAQSCLTLCDPMNRSMPGLPVHHQLPDFTQTYIHRVGDAIQPSHPLPSPFPPAPNPSQHQSLFQWVNSFAWGGQSTEVSASASFLPNNTQGWSPSEWTGWISLKSKGLSRVFSNTTVQQHQFFDAQPSSQSNSHIHTWPLEKP